MDQYGSITLFCSSIFWEEKKKKAKETSEKNYVFMWIYKKYILQSTFSEILGGNGKRETVAIGLTTFP